MLRVVETFSGIGSQAKALKRAKIEHEIMCTVEWDINAIIAYDFIHNGKQNLEKYERMCDESITNILSKYSFSSNGKKIATKKSIINLDRNVKNRLLCALENNNNLVSITDVKGDDLPKEIDLLTYSFPCQDLSLAGQWHGNKGGIDRNAHNRSGMLWEIERILKERENQNIKLPKFLLMENVSNILSKKHSKDFKEWTDYLESVGYYNQIYILNSSNFGIPQRRVRVYMISVLVKNDVNKRDEVKIFFDTHNLNDNDYVKSIEINKKSLEDILRLDYKNKQYRHEADLSQPNDTNSRKEIFQKNELLYNGNKIATKIVPTVTTKQDRHPNSGVIVYNNDKVEKSKFRYLTPRECFLLMGFDEMDYQNIIDNNFKVRNRSFFTVEKLNKMAGNSIVVNVLENIFKQLEYVKNNILIENESKNNVDNIELYKEKLLDFFNLEDDGFETIS